MGWHCALVAATVAHVVVARPAYVPWNPNSLGIPWTIAIGHKDPWGQGPINFYGIDFGNNDYQWNRALACMDSDGDGWPNGFELGDPCGVWRFSKHKCPPMWTNDISHPGNKSSVPLTRALNYTLFCGHCVCDDHDVQEQISKLYRMRNDFIAGLAEPLDAWRQQLLSELSQTQDDPPPPGGNCSHPRPPQPGPLAHGSGHGGHDYRAHSRPGLRGDAKAPSHPREDGHGDRH